ncbi:ferritin family protein [Spirochaetota bacterium]
MAQYNPGEIFQFAIRIEESGEKFYRDKAESITNEKIKALFNKLADDEADHKKTFEDMVSSIESYKPDESYPAEYFLYIRSYVDRAVFGDEKVQTEAAAVGSELAAVDFALKVELLTILYYQEMKSFVAEGERDKIEGIIAEERTHVIYLSGIKVELQK